MRYIVPLGLELGEQLEWVASAAGHRDPDPQPGPTMSAAGTEDWVVVYCRRDHYFPKQRDHLGYLGCQSLRLLQHYPSGTAVVGCLGDWLLGLPIVTECLTEVVVPREMDLVLEGRPIQWREYHLEGEEYRPNLTGKGHLFWHQIVPILTGHCYWL